MRAIVGLGNPGRRYAGTRHNAGFWCVEAFGRRHGVRLDERRRTAVLGRGTVEGGPVVLALPRTYMNASGEAVGYLTGRFGLAPARVLVVYDDLDLPPGRIRLRPRGSAGGHQGMASVIAALATEEFPRLRVGIGRPAPGGDPVEYVLGRPGPEERLSLERGVETAVDALDLATSEGLEAAMSRFN